MCAGGGGSRAGRTRPGRAQRGGGEGAMVEGATRGDKPGLGASTGPPEGGGGGPEVLEGGGRRGRVCAWDWRRLLTPPFSSVPEGLGPHTRPGKRAHPELRAGVGEEVHFAEVVARGQQLPLVRPADGVDVRPVRALWPHA